jgi:hypothetical protein
VLFGVSSHTEFKFFDVISQKKNLKLEKKLDSGFPGSKKFLKFLKVLEIPINSLNSWNSFFYVGIPEILRNSEIPRNS